MRRATAACAARLWTHGSFARALSTVRTPTDRRTSVGSAHSVIHGSPAASEAAYTARRRRLGQNAPHQAPELGPRSVFVNQEVALAQLEWGASLRSLSPQRGAAANTPPPPSPPTSLTPLLPARPPVAVGFDADYTLV